MTWSIVSSPSVATELYHVTDTGNNFGFLFASLLFSIAASVIVFLLFISFNPILMEEASVDFSRLLKRSQFVSVICYVWSLGSHAG